MNKKLKILSQCCACKKVKRKEGHKHSNRAHMDEWGHHHEDLKKIHDEFCVLYSHTYCEDCAEDFIKKEFTKPS